MIIRIGNNDTIRIGHCDVMRMLKRTFFFAASAEFPDKGSIWLENLQESFVDEISSISSSKRHEHTWTLWFSLSHT